MKHDKEQNEEQLERLLKSAETMDLIDSGMIDVEKYVSNVLTVEQLPSVFERLTSLTEPVLKVVVKP